MAPAAILMEKFEVAGVAPVGAAEEVLPDVSPHPNRTGAGVPRMVFEILKDIIPAGPVPGGMACTGVVPNKIVGAFG